MNKFISTADVSKLHDLLNLAKLCKSDTENYKNTLSGKTLGMLFLNPSLRTRMSTEHAAQILGMHVISMNVNDAWNIEFEDGAIMNGDKAEHVREMAAVMSQYCDVLGIRAFPSLTDKVKDYSDETIHKFAQFARVPVMSLESAIRHPLQSLTDWLTIEEFKKKKKPKVVLTWAPHPKALPQAVPNSFLEWVRHGNYELIITHPEGYELDTQFTEGLPIDYDQNNAFKNADFIYAKNWSSFSDYGKILNLDPNWTVNEEKMALTNNAKFMHCLPVRRNQVVTDGVLDSKNSIVIQQAHNRTYAAMAVLLSLLKI